MSLVCIGVPGWCSTASFFNSDLTFIRSLPRWFCPEPSPPSPQYLSFLVCSTSFLSPVPSSMSLNSLCWENFAKRALYITFCLTCSQSPRNHCDTCDCRDSENASRGVCNVLIYFKYGVPTNFCA